ncbi:MAG TPA: DNA polymerase III subunit chi [Gammaproteobacteria bacterium]|nr:DNA polymerase III subunit chi [Gammaproteobacteria bacterium]
MTEVDFYILGEDAAQARLRFACRIADKAYRLGKQVHIHTESARQTRELDDLLWTFQQNSFVPHARYQDAGEQPPPVLLAHDAEPPSAGEVLINLAPEVPLFFSRFERVAEVVDTDAETRRRGRARYSFYRERGYPLRSHEIGR